MFIKKNFCIIPVIDILNSKAVHAVKGERSEYKPLDSYLFDSANPQQIIFTLYNEFNFMKYYIADLDSIIHNKPNIAILKKLLTQLPQISVILDPGIEKIRDLKRFSKLPRLKLILGLETISRLDIISEAVHYLGEEQIIVSIDMYKGNIYSKNQYIQDSKPLELIKEIKRFKVSNIILLDLYRVGQKIGGIPALYKDIKEIFQGNILVGGGIKNIADVRLYQKNNFGGVLIGTALYDESIKKKEIESFFKKVNQQ